MHFLQPLFHAKRLCLLLFRAVLMIVLGFAWTASTVPVLADPLTGEWTPQRRIPQYDNEARTPIMVTDHAGKVYAFNVQPDGPSLQAIFIREWTVDQGWSPPVDILLSPLSGAPVIEGVFFESAGIIHLVFFAGNEVYGAHYYTWAPAYLADQPQAWSKPEIIGDNSVFLGSALTGDDHGHLYLIYGGKQDGIGLYVLTSNNSGHTWSDPKLITLMQDNNLLPNGTDVGLDSEGHLHIIWSEVDPSGTDWVIYYDRLDIKTMQWSQPFAIARRVPGDYKAAWPSIIVYKKSLMVIYQDSNPGTRWMRQSFDSGSTWTDPVRPWTFVGEYRQAVLLVDSSDTLHIILGNRSGDCCHGMWHGVWMGDHWGPLQPIVMGPRTPQFDPSDPHAIMVQGNVLLATWWTDSGGAPRNGIWYSYLVLDAPGLPMKPLPQPEITKTSVETSIPASNQVVQVLPTSTPLVLSNISSPEFTRKPVSHNPGLPVIAGMLSAFIMMISIFILRLVITNRR